MTRIIVHRSIKEAQISLTVLAVVLLVACGAQERERVVESREPQISLTPQVGEGLSLEGFVLRPTVATGDSVYVGYVIRNGGAARRLVLDPRFFEVQVIGPDGPSAEKPTESWTGSTGDESVVVLPYLGIVGRIFALPCGNPGFSAIETCNDHGSSLVPGNYRIVLTYSPPPPPESRAERIRLTSDTITIRVRVDSP